MDHLEIVMLRSFFLLVVFAPSMTWSQTWFEGEPVFADDASRTLAAELLHAHGGMAPMAEANSLQFSFFTKMIGNPTPFYSKESLDLATGNALVDWPFWNSTIGWDGKNIWTRNWPMPLPGGFFVRLTSSFLTLPWQIHSDNATIGPVFQDKLPGDDTVYDVLRITYQNRHPGIPGTFYEIFVHPNSHLMTGLRFDINHPGMVANPSQPLGPNYHVFSDYRTFDGLVIPTFYKSFGTGSSAGGESNAYHVVWDLQVDQAFDSHRIQAPSDAMLDQVSASWWQSNDNTKKEQ
jgi:hypothetical protein